MSAPDAYEPPQLCSWWAFCFNPATTERWHPVLGWVPICQRCDDKVDRL